MLKSIKATQQFITICKSMLQLMQVAERAYASCMAAKQLTWHTIFFLPLGM